jgi:hypothetical protein
VAIAFWKKHPIQKGCVSHYGLAIYMKKNKNLKAKKKKKIWKLEYFTMKIMQSFKNPLKQTKILQDIIIL